jgi:hypothetical protein
MPKVATAIRATRAGAAPTGRRCDNAASFLRRKFGSRALGERICSTEDVIEQREGRFNLKVVKGAPAASRLLVELPCRVFWQGFEGQSFGDRPGDEL